MAVAAAAVESAGPAVTVAMEVAMEVAVVVTRRE